MNQAPSPWITGDTELDVGQGGSWDFGVSDDGNLKWWRFYASTNPDPQWSPISSDQGPLTHTASFSSPGTYTWIVDAEDLAGLSSSTSITVSVKVPVTFTVSPTSFTYNGNSQGPLITPSVTGASWSVTAGQQTATAAGNYSVTATASGNYKGTSGAVAWNIDRRAATFSINGPFTYDGSSKTAVITSNPAGATFSTGGTLAATNIGTYTATATATGNYQGASGPMSWSIDPPAEEAVTIHSQTGDRTQSVGHGTNFSVNASGGGTLSYQWYKNSSPISGATASGYSIQSVQMSDAGAYTVRVSNSTSSVTSSPDILIVVARFEPRVAFPLVAPLQAEVGEQITVGGTIYDDDGDLRTATARWNGAVKQTWTDLDTAMAYRYTVMFVTGTPSQASTFSMEATDSAYTGSGATGFAQRSTTTEIIGTNSPPETTSASALPNSSDGSIKLSGSATDSDGNLAYLVFSVSYPPAHTGYDLLCSVPVDTQGNGSYTWRPSPALADGTYYVWVKAQDSAGAIDASAAVASFTIYSAPPPPVPSVLIEASEVPIRNPVTVTYEGASASSSTIGLYRASDPDGAPVIPAIVLQSDHGSVSFPTANLAVGQTYQARLFAGAVGTTARIATSNSFRITENWTLVVENGTGGRSGLQTDLLHPVSIAANPPQGNELFAGWVHISGPGQLGDPTMAATTFTINGGDARVQATYRPPAAPAIVVQPESMVRSVGQSVVFSVVASGAPAPTYQWRKNGVDIPGATLSRFILNGVVAGDAGTYSVVVENSQGRVVSTPAALTVESSDTIWAAIGVSPGWSTVVPGSTTVEWTTAGATSVSVTGAGISDANSTAPNGSQTIGNLPLGPHTYTLTAQSPSGTVTRQATFTVTGDLQSPLVPLPDEIAGPAILGSVVGTLGGSLSVDNRGAANYVIPLQITPGRAGMQPQLSLRYNSAAGSGVVGLGWSISTGYPAAITRGRSILARDGEVRGVTFTGADKFYLDGQRLLATGTTVYGQPGRYRTEVDSFMDIIATASGSGAAIDTFTATGKQGVKYIFGRMDAEVDGFQKGGGETGPMAYAYALKKVQDTLGNTVVFNYTNVGGGEHLLASIVYTGKDGGRGSESVEFAYTGNRFDQPVSYIADRQFYHRARLAWITAKSDAATIAAAYQLVYETPSPEKSGHSRLLQVKPALADPANGALHAVEATTFEWTKTDVSYVNNPALICPPYSSDQTLIDHYAFADVNGDGKDDFVKFDGDTVLVAISDGTGFGSLAAWGTMPRIAADTSSLGLVRKMGDINGDGKKDIVYGRIGWGSSPGYLYALVSTGTAFVPLGGGTGAKMIFTFSTEFQDPTPPQGNGPTYTILNLDQGAAAARISVADFTGDGLADILIHRYDGRLTLVKATGVAFTALEPVSVGAMSLKNGATSGPRWNPILDGFQPVRNFAVAPILCDLNGDGITDYAWTESTQMLSDQDGSGNSSPSFLSCFCARKLHAVTSQPGEPGHEFSQAVLDIATMSWTWGGSLAVGSLPYRQNTFVILPGDINGDGLTDFVVLHPAMTSDPQVKTVAQEVYFSRGTAGTPSFDKKSGLIPTTVTARGAEVYSWFDKVTATDMAQYFASNHTNIPEESDLIEALGVSSPFENVALADVNLDGRDDYVWYVDTDSVSGWYVMYSSGGGFSSPVAAPLGWTHSQKVGRGAATATVSSRASVDLNGDGVPDYAYDNYSYKFGPGAAGVLVSQKPRGDQIQSITNGLNSVTTVAYRPITDDTVYTPGAVDNPGTPEIEGVRYPIRELRNATYVVSEVKKDTGGTEPARFTYQYSGNRLDLSGRGSLGFHSFVTLDEQTHLFKYQFLTQSFPMTGLAAREETYRWWNAGGKDNFRFISSHDNTVVFDRVGSYGTVWPFISQAVEYRWEDDPITPHFSFDSATVDSHPEQLFPKDKPNGYHIKITAKSWFDNQSPDSEPQTGFPGSYYASDYNPANSEETRNVVSGTVDFKAYLTGTTQLGSANYGKITYGNLTQLLTSYDDDYTEKIETAYKPGEVIGGVMTLTGRPETVKTTVTSPDYATQTAPVKTYTYTPGTPLITSEEIAGGGKLTFKTTHTRDALGRITATELNGQDLTKLGANDQTYNIYSVSPVTAFDPKFDLPKIEKNAYGHTTTTEFDPLLGKPISVMGPNSDTTTFTYDALGRTTEVKDLLKNLTTTISYEWNASQAVALPPTDRFPPDAPPRLKLTSAYSVTTQPTAKPIVTAYYDRLGRVIRVAREAFGTGRIYTDTVYNTLGQVAATTLPYPAATAAPPDSATRYWTTTVYDALGRVSKVTAPNKTVTTTTYDGRTTSVTVDAPPIDGIAPQTTTTLVDAKGQTVKVWNPDPATGSASSTVSLEFKLDGFGRMRKTIPEETTDSAKQITATYDALGRQLTLTDPDKGPWSYVNSALGYVLQQTDARLNVTDTAYDKLGRPIVRTTQEPSSGPRETAGWFYYDSATAITDFPSDHLVALGTKGWIGALQRDEVSTTGAPGYAATHSATSTVHYYNPKGLPAIDLTTIDDKWFYTYTDYDDFSRVQNLRHFWRPAGRETPDNAPYIWQDFGYTYGYDAKSYLTSLTDSLGRSWWDSPSYDHLDRVTSVRKGSGHTTVRTYRPEDGVLRAITTGPTAGASSIQNLSFTYDGLGNLRSRSGSGGSETLDYDSLNRLTLSNEGTISYDSNGNLLSKGAVGGATTATYNYDNTPSRPHAVHQAFGYTMGYDANGNLSSRTGNGETWNLRYAGFDKPRWMAKTAAGKTAGSEFLYNANRSRTVQVEFDQMNGAATDQVPSHYVRKRVYGLGSTLEANYDYVGGSTPWTLKKVRIYVPGPDGVIGAREFDSDKPAGSQETALVYHYDHLGSIESITPFGSAVANTYAADTGNKSSRYSYDAWGQRRNPLTWNGRPPATTDDGGADSLTPRGFTGHEMLDDLGLVHMNGRIYDPLLGRMLSSDVLIQFPKDLQSYNRYSYVRNNPLTAVDPSGWSETFETPANGTAVIGRDGYITSYSQGTRYETLLDNLQLAIDQGDKSAIARFSQALNGELDRLTSNGQSSFLSKRQLVELGSMDRARLTQVLGDSGPALIESTGRLGGALKSNEQSTVASTSVRTQTHPAEEAVTSGSPKATTTSEIAPQVNSTKLFTSRLPLQDPVNAGRLVQVNGQYKIRMPDGSLRTPRGTQNFVTLPDGRILVSGSAGHTGISRGRDVAYAGQIQFSGKGELKQWDNASGHYLPDTEAATQAGLPMERFVPRKPDQVPAQQR